MLVLELAREAGTAASSEQLGELAAQFVAAGAEAPAHLLHLAGAVQRCSSRLPLWPLPAAGAGGAAASAAAASLDTPGGACLAAHLWSVIVLY